MLQIFVLEIHSTKTEILISLQKKLVISVTINLHKAKCGCIVCDIFSGHACQTEHCFVSGIFFLHCHLYFSLKSFRQYWKLD